MERKDNKKISLSIIISILTMIATFIVSFFFVSFLLSKPQIGDVNYGLKTTADSFVSFITVFSFGMTTTFITFHKKYGKNNEKKTFSVFVIISLLIAIIGIIFGIILVLLSINGVILSHEKYTATQIHDFTLILIVSMFSGISSIILYINKYYLESSKKIVLVRLINLLITVAYPVVSIPIVLNGGGIIAVSIVYASVHLVGNLAYFCFACAQGGKLFSFKMFDKQIFREVLIYSFFVVVASAVETFSFSIDKVILTISIGASLATIYQLSITLNQVLLSLADLFYAPYIPYLSEMDVDEQHENIEKTYLKVSKILLFISLIVLTGFILVGKEFVVLWVGEEKIQLYYYTIAIFSVWPFYSVAKFSTSLHRIYGKHKISTIHYLISFAIHFLCSLAFIKLLGIWSCFIGLSASMLYLGISLLIVNKKALHLRYKPMILLMIKCFVIAALCFGASFLIKTFVISSINMPTIANVIVNGFVLLIFWLAFIVLTQIDKVKTAILNCLRKILLAIKTKSFVRFAINTLICSASFLVSELLALFIQRNNIVYITTFSILLFLTIIANNVVVLYFWKRKNQSYNASAVFVIELLALVFSGSILLLIAFFMKINSTSFMFIVLPCLPLLFSFVILFVKGVTNAKR